MRQLWYLLTELRTAVREAEWKQGRRNKGQVRDNKCPSARVTASWSTIKIKITKSTIIKLSASTCENN